MLIRSHVGPAELVYRVCVDVSNYSRRYQCVLFHACMHIMLSLADLLGFDVISDWVFGVGGLGKAEPVK
jgi:hypothetical protein